MNGERVQSERNCLWSPAYPGIYEKMRMNLMVLLGLSALENSKSTK